MDALTTLVIVLETEATRLMDQSSGVKDPVAKALLREEVMSLDATSGMVQDILSDRSICLIQPYTTDPCRVVDVNCDPSDPSLVYVPLSMHQDARRRFIQCPLTFEDQCDGINGIYLPLCGDAFPVNCFPVVDFCDSDSLYRGRICEPAPDCLSFVCHDCDPILPIPHMGVR